MNSRMENTILTYLNNKYKDLDVVKSKKFPTCLFYKHNGKILFDYNKKYNCTFICREITSLIKSFFDIPVKDMNKLLSKWIESVSGNTPNIIYDDYVSKIRWSKL